MAEQAVSKSQAVKEALGTLGRDVKPSDIRDWVKQTYGLEMSLNHISNIKSTSGKKGRGKGKGRGKSRTEAKTTPMAAPAPRKQSGGAIRLEDVEAVKKLSQRIGVDSMRHLIDLLG